MTSSATHAAVTALSVADEERLAELVEQLSEVDGPDAVPMLERLATEHPDLAGHLR